MVRLLAVCSAVAAVATLVYLVWIVLTPDPFAPQTPRLTEHCTTIERTPPG